MATKWQGEPKRWRVRAQSSDGMTVTLGRHDTEKAAEAEAQKFLQEGSYRNVTVERIEPAEDTAPQDA